MHKSLSKDFSKLSNKENKFQTPSRENTMSTSRTVGFEAKEKSRPIRSTLQEQDSNVKPSVLNNNKSEWNGKTETTLPISSNRDDLAKNQVASLEARIQELLNEKKELEETVREMSNKAEDYNIMEEKATKLQMEVNKNAQKMANLENLEGQVEILRSENRRFQIEFDRERAVYESKIADLKEQLETKDKRLEQRIVNEHSNRQALNANMNRMLDQNDKWKKLYMMEAKNIIALQQQYKSLIEDNKCHIEYITQLEDKIQQLEAKYYELYTDYHQKLTEYRIENLKNTQQELERIRGDFSEEEFEKVEEKFMINALQNELNKEKEVSADFKAQVSRLLDVRQELERNLALSRHNLLEATGRLEEESAKVSALEDMRINDLQYISTLENEL